MAMRLIVVPFIRGENVHFVVNVNDVIDFREVISYVSDFARGMNFLGLTRLTQITLSYTSTTMTRRSANSKILIRTMRKCNAKIKALNRYYRDCSKPKGRLVAAL